MRRSTPTADEDPAARDRARAPSPPPTAPPPPRPEEPRRRRGSRRLTIALLTVALFVVVLFTSVILLLVRRGEAEIGPRLSEPQAHELVERYIRARNQPDLSLLEEIYSPEVVVHDVGTSEAIRGLDELESMWVNTHLAFPDFHLELEDVTSAGAFVIARWRMTGTNTGPLEQVEATGRAINVPGVSLVRVDGGRIGEEWIYWDTWELYRQLGFTLVAPEVGAE